MNKEELGDCSSRAGQGTGSPCLCQMLLLAKSCKKYLDLLEKSCNFAAETMEKSCRLPPIVYGIIDIGKVFGNATFLRCFSKNNAIPFQNRFETDLHCLS